MQVVFLLENCVACSLKENSFKVNPRPILCVCVCVCVCVCTSDTLQNNPMKSIKMVYV